MPYGSRTGPSGTIPSLAATTIRRSIIVGRLYFAVGSFWAAAPALAIALVARNSFGIGFPFFLPIAAVLGSMGGLMTFTSDRTKGVFEYLISYGVRPRTLFVNALVSSATLAGILMAIALAVGLGAAAARGVPLSWATGIFIALYAIPMGFATVLFTATVGMIWSSLSTPRSGLNSPVGIAPLVGIAPTFLVIVGAVLVPTSDAYYVLFAAPVVTVAVVVGLLSMSARLMRRERFLSPL